MTNSGLREFTKGLNVKNVVNGIEIPEDIDRVPEVLAYIRGHEDARDESPLVQGGQGRTPDALIMSAWVILAWLAVGVVVVAVAMILGRS